MKKKQKASSAKTPSKPAVKKPAPKKPAPKKSAPKKVVPKKAAPKKISPSKKPLPKKAVSKKPIKKTTVLKKSAPKKSPDKKIEAPKKIVAKKPLPKKAAAKVSSEQKPAGPVSKSQSIRDRLIARKQEHEKSRPAAFTLDEIREIAKVAAKADATEKAAAHRETTLKTEKLIAEKLAKQKNKPNRVQAASLADILGFNPAKKQKPTDLDLNKVPERFRKYYKLLVDLRTGLTHQIDEHSEETLKRSNKDDAGDLSSYGQHDADAGTDAFDRDFALSMVASEQEALTEIESAIQRIKNGTYGICEITHKPISKDRLTAVPFTKYSTEAQKEIERYRLRSRSQPGIFGTTDEGGQAIGTAGGDDSDD